MKYRRLLVSVLVSQGAGLVGSIFTAPAIPNWYANLNKPSFSPPNWLFGPVWVSLYALMGVAAWLVWRQGLDKKPVKVALALFFTQLIFNSLWSIVFFGLRSPFYGLMEILALWFLILATTVSFFKISKLAGWLLIPYLCWVSFAAFLNFWIFKLN